MTRVQCEYCGKFFNRKPSEIGARIFCSIECYKKAEHTKRGKYVQCKYCGKLIYQMPHRLKRNKHFFCSYECRGKWVSENLKGVKATHYKNALFHKICAFCGKEFTTYFKIAKYCSQACYFNARRLKNSIDLVCPICGKKFRRHKSASVVRGKKHNFCSIECKNLFMKRENHPNWIEDRGMLKDSNHSFRERAELKEWRKKVFERDDYICQICHNRTTKGNQVILNAHHIKKVKDYPLLAFVVSNGITLCKGCHLKILGKEEEYEEMFKSILMAKEELKREFDKRIKTLELDKKAKEELYNRFLEIYNNGFMCAYCKERMELKYENEYGWTIDHIIPRKVGGKDIVENLTFCCRSCNFQKKVMSAEEYRTKMEQLKLRKQKREYWKAKNSTKKDEQTRDAYKDIFERVNAKKEKA